VQRQVRRSIWAALIGTAPTRQPILVAVDGLGGVAKSKLADKVAARRADRVVINGDDFYGLEERDWRDWSPEQDFELHFDQVRLAREVLIPLRADRPASFQCYDGAAYSLGDWAHGVVVVVVVVVVEGVSLLRPRMRPYWTRESSIPRRVRRSRWVARGEIGGDGPHPKRSSLRITV
jgi:uridine kinase